MQFQHALRQIFHGVQEETEIIGGIGLNFFFERGANIFKNLKFEPLIPHIRPIVFVAINLSRRNKTFYRLIVEQNLLHILISAEIIFSRPTFALDLPKNARFVIADRLVTVHRRAAVEAFDNLEFRRCIRIVDVQHQCRIFSQLLDQSKSLRIKNLNARMKKTPPTCRKYFSRPTVDKARVPTSNPLRV